MMLDCEKHLRLRQPEFLVPIHKDTPDDLLRSACELVRLGTGKPKFVSLETMQKMRMADPMPYTLEELRNLVWAGCGENTIPAVERSGVDSAWYTGLPLALELALNNGVSRLTGEKWGLETGNPRKFKSFDEVMEAFKKQVANAVRHRCIHSDAIIMAQSQIAPAPFRSAFIFDCLGKGLDIYRGGAKYNFDVGADVGITTCGDCLAAIKKVVFDEKKITMPELLDAMDANFEGKEDLRQMLLSAPKFGNDDDQVDLITRQIARFASLEHRRHPHIHGGMHRSSHTTVTAGIAIGRMVGATPDGRKAGEPLNEGGVSPHQGRDTKGPTAVMKSVSKLDWQTAYGGVLNIKLTTNALKGDEGVSLLMALIRAYHDMGGFHVQFNCVDLKTLRDAQKHPEKYQDLLVRVGAYSAYFIQLSRVLQDDIISRTEHDSVY
jgi:formate C-acetyltransferase